VLYLCWCTLDENIIVVCLYLFLILFLIIYTCVLFILTFSLVENKTFITHRYTLGYTQGCTHSHTQPHTHTSTTIVKFTWWEYLESRDQKKKEELKKTKWNFLISRLSPSTFHNCSTCAFGCVCVCMWVSAWMRGKSKF